MLRTRLSNQRLTFTTFRRPEEVVAWFGAVQAQDYAGAKWALGLRATGLTDAAVERAFDEGRILRTHVLRPTWHFVTAKDIRWMLALSGERIRRANRAYAQRLGIDDRLVTRARAVLERALAGRQHRTRAEIAAILRRSRIDVSARALAHLLFDLEAQAIVCSGPGAGKQFTYALLEERAPRARSLSRDEAIAELARRYFRSHGPATVRDFAWWSGLTMGDARRGAEAVKAGVLDRGPEPSRVAGATYLLPNFDEYLVAYRDRQAVADPGRARNLGVFTEVGHPHYLIVDGRIAGGWRYGLNGDRVSVRVRTYDELPRRHVNAVSEAAARYGSFVGKTPEVHIDG